MLLNIDGLDKRWEKGVKSPFEGELGWHALNDVERYAPLIFRRVLSNLSNVRTLDSSTMSRHDVTYADAKERETAADKTKLNLKY